MRCTELHQPPPAKFLFVRKNGKGRGVYTGRDIPKHTTVLQDPVIFFRDSEAKPRSLVHRYTFQWKEPGWSALALGLVSIVNHSYTPNCEYRMDCSNCTIRIHTRIHIRRGQELTINYNYDPDDQTPVPFKVIE